MSPILFYEDLKYKKEAITLAEYYGFSIAGVFSQNSCTLLLADSDQQPILNLTQKGLMVYSKNTTKPWTIDFLSTQKHYRRHHGGSEMLVRACGIKKNQPPQTVLDLTAGLGRDAFVLACAGAKVIMIERHPIIAALLENAIQRLYSDTEASKNIQLTLYFDNAENFLKNQLQILIPDFPDVIYLDPMHPKRQKSASVKKEMQMLQSWIPPENHPEVLLNLSLPYATQRVVIKWPRKAPALLTMTPDFSYEENTVRFEIYKNSSPQRRG